MVSGSQRWSWDEWLAGLGGAAAARAEALRVAFIDLGAPDPESWARSEIDEDIPQLARLAFLRAVWRQIEEWREIDTVPALTGKVSGEVVALAVRVATQAAFHTALGVIGVIDDEEDVATPAAPGWRLVECDAEGRPTGRVLSGLHESFLAADPRGIEANDILDA